MRTTWIVCVALVPALAAADDSRPYVTHNGRGVEAAVTSSNQTAAPAAPAVGFGANMSRPGVVSAAAAAANAAVNSAADSAGAAGAAPQASGDNNQSFAGRSVRAPRGFTKRRGLTGTGGTGGSGGTGGTGTTEAPPPNFSKPGALIRTAGQLPVYSDPGNARTTSVEGGGLITIDQSKAHDVARSNGVTYGAPDTRPGANPNSGSGSGGSAVTSNGGAAATTNGAGVSGAATTGGANNGDSGGGNGKTGRKDSSAPPTGTGFDGSF